MLIRSRTTPTAIGTFRYHQTYQMDTLPMQITEAEMQPGDLVFTQAPLYDTTKTPKQNNITHVEIWMGDGKKTLGARWATKVIEIHVRPCPSVLFHSGLCKSKEHWSNSFWTRPMIVNSKVNSQHADAPFVSSSTNPFLSRPPHCCFDGAIVCDVPTTHGCARRTRTSSPRRSTDQTSTPFTASRRGCGASARATWLRGRGRTL
jgi:hypothetical protein